MADEMTVIDASGLASINYSQYLADYFSTVGTVAGQATYYGGEYSASVFGYNSGSQYGVRYNATTNDKQVLMEGTAIQYDGIDGVHHGAYSGDVDSITFGAYNEGTTFTTGENNGPRSELTGVVEGLVISNLGISTAYNTMAGPGNEVYTLMNLLKNAAISTDGVQINIQKLYALFASQAQHFIGTAGDDVYTGTEFGDLIEGGAGFDTLAGGLGDDVYVVTDRNNNLVEAVGEGIDTIQTAISHYLIRDNIENIVQTGIAGQFSYGNTLDNTMTATSAGGYLYGQEGNDTLIGGAGNDVLDGGVGNDVMTGGLGDDTYGIDSADDVFVELEGQGTDTVETSLNFYQIAAVIENLTLIGTENLHGYGNDGNNVITGNTGANILAGLAGNDTLDGGEGADSLYGGAGSDVYIVDNKGDVVSEADTETGADVGGTDRVESSVSYKLGAFVENLTLLNSVDDEVKTANLSGKGNALGNVIVGNEASNALFGYAGNDTIRGDAGNDTIQGGDGKDKIDGGSGNDTIGGGKGNDTILGGAGKDNIHGGDGNDSIYGGAGIDTLAGGRGADTFFFKAGETAAAKNSADTITDFSGKMHDLIDLHTFDANTEKKGNQDFDFIGTDAFSKHAGELRYEKTAHDTYVMGDTNGDGKADFTIHLDGGINLVDDFFVL